jgi:3-oxoacyl-[acyl-carrier protein] reductase
VTLKANEASDYDIADIHEGAAIEHGYEITEDIYAQFLSAFGDLSPLHVDEAYAVAAGFRHRVMHGAIVNGFVSHFVGMVFPGRRSLLLSVDLRYGAPSYLGDRLLLRMTVDRLVESQRVLLLNAVMRRPADGATVATGRLQVKVLAERAPMALRNTVAEAALIVTGGTKGLGRALSLAFGLAGYEVLALYQRDGAAAHVLDADFAAAGINGRSILHDVTHDGFPEIPTGKRLVLINNAAARFEPKPMHLLHWEDLEQNLMVALKGSFRASQAVLRPMLKEGGGTIVNVLSSSVYRAPKGFGAYVPAKLALLGFTRSLAAEYAERGVRVFSVSPGFMNTPLTQGWSPQLRSAILSTTEAGDADACAQFILDLVLRDDLVGRGENYLYS